MVENENNLCHFPDLDNAIIQPSKIKTYLKLIIIFLLDIPSQIEAKFMWRAKEWWKLIYWSTKLTYKFRIEQKSCTHKKWWNSVLCTIPSVPHLNYRTEQNCMFMLLLLVHQSQFVTIWRHPVVTTSKDSRFHFPIPKWPPGVALWDQYRYIFKRLRIVPPVVAYRVYIHYTKKLSYWLVNC